MMTITKISIQTVYKVQNAHTIHKVRQLIRQGFSKDSQVIRCPNDSQELCLCT